MERVSTTILIIIGITIIFVIAPFFRRKNKKEWNIFEHQEGNADNPNKYYSGQHKRTGYNTKHYSTKEELLSAIQKEGVMWDEDSYLL